MQDTKALWDGTKGEFIGNAVSAQDALAIPSLTVTIGDLAGGPDPAAFAFGDLRPEVFSERHGQFYRTGACMYSLKAILQKQPSAIAGALRSILYIAVLAGLLVMDEKLLAGIALGAEVLLGLFVYNNVTPTAAPTLASGTEVSVKGSEDKITIPEGG
jgi:hypothetical protein